MPATDAAVLRAFADTIRVGLLNDHTVHVAGLGTFRREHEPSRFDDTVLPPRLLPPREVVHFAPETPPRRTVASDLPLQYDGAANSPSRSDPTRSDQSPRT
ncbi:MAG: hypothetical protein AAFQ53_00705 [Bacteroidota bacterium]